jgi:HK97 family phage major capsid protein
VDKNHSTSVSGGLTVGRRVETQAATASRMEFEQVILNAQSLFGLAFASEELLARSPVSFVAILEAGFRDEFPAKLINERLNGTGTGMFEGVINAPCIVSVAKETGQAADTIVYENIVKMRSRCWGYGNAIWLANHDTLPQLMLMNQAVGTGGVVVWQPSAREGEPELLLGRPIVFTEFTKTIGDTGDIVLGNWSQYLEGTLTPMQQAESMHVRFENHERTFKFWVENDGRCWWRSALTPKNSSNTLSPFVKLDSR